MEIERIKSLSNEVKEDALYVEVVLNQVVSDYCTDLDRIMLDIQRDVIMIDAPAIMTVEKYFMELSNALYFMCERVEKLGVYDSVSKAKAQETYNKKYLEVSVSNPATGKKPTVGETQAISDNEALYDRTVNDIYNRAYKILKNKVEAAETMVGTLSKVLSHRMQESQLTGMQSGRMVLNEGNII